MKKVLYTVIVCFTCALFAQTQKPNVIIIYADDLGYGDLSCYNKKSKINTPHIDALAEKGILFNDAHSTSSVCSPSRYGLLMGRYQWRGKLKKGIVGEWGDPVLEPELQTLAELFKQNKYQTAMIGKWHLGMTWPFKEGKGQTTHQKWKSRIKGNILPTDFNWDKGISNGPLQHGFDSYFGDGTINFPPYAFIRNNRFETPPVEMLKTQGLPDEGKWECRKGPAAKKWDIRAVPERNQYELIKWLKNHKKNKPFFVYYALSGPHAPIIPENKNRSQAGAYGAYVEEIDDWVGEIVQTLKAKKQYKNTIIVFSSDNGPEHYAYPRIKKFNHHSNAQLNGLKRDLTEGGHRVPLIFSYPEKIKENVQYPHLTSQMDLYRTFASLLNAKTAKKNGEDSISFAHIINKNSREQPHRDLLIHHTVNGSFALRKGDWLYLQPKKKYITHGHPKSMPFVSEKGWLFNLKQDLGQMENKIDSELNKAEEMREALISLSK